MKLCIGENIKRLRRERDMTQEELAELLNVSFQSVSRWENGACYPDLELIPAIAGFFGVSADSLMGLDDSYEKAAIQLVLDEFQLAISRGDVESCIAVARQGLKDHPESYAIMNKLMYALFIAGDETGNIPDWKANMERYDEEITRLGERIMKYCPDQAIRLEATARLAFNHCEMGRKKQGRAIYEQLPGLDCVREGQIWWALDDEERAENARRLIEKSLDLMCAGIWQLVNSNTLPDDQREAAARKYIEIDALVQDGNAPPFNGQRYMRLARILARQGKAEEAVAQLALAAQTAKAFDARPEQGATESLLLGRREWKRSDYETADSRPVARVLRDVWMQHEDFAGIRETDGFRRVEESLEDV